MAKFKTINDAAHAWVSEFNAIPQEIVAKLLRNNHDELMEITPLAVGDMVYASHFGWTEGEIISTPNKNESGKYIVRFYGDDDETEEYDGYQLERSGDTDFLPMWGTMWAFGEWLDNEWLENHGGLQLMADCGFRIYEQEDYGYIFGIDGAGYDFYEAHWIPLYEARGLHWHETEVE